MLKRKSYFFSRAVGGLANSPLQHGLYLVAANFHQKFLCRPELRKPSFPPLRLINIYGPIIDHYSFKRTSYYSILFKLFSYLPQQLRFTNLAKVIFWH